MPHATEPHNVEDDRDQALIERVLDPQNTELDWTRELEPGEKADDAVDFEDIGDDDLADDEEVDGERDLQGQSEEDVDTTSNGLDALMQDGDLYGSTSGNIQEDEGLDDLFADPQSPRDTDGGAGQPHVKLEHADDLFDFGDNEALTAQPQAPPAQETPSQPLYSPATGAFKDAPLSKEQQIQQELFAMSRLGQSHFDVLPAPPENQEELLASLWPKFKRNTIPKFMDLLAPKKAHYTGMTNPKTPKPVNPTKISLELAQDQEKNFRVLSASNKRAYEDVEESGLVSIQAEIVNEKTNEENGDMESDLENDTTGGISWQDLQILCEDWDTRSLSDSVASDEAGLNGDMFPKPDVDLEYGIEWPPGKVSQVEPHPHVIY